MRSLIFKTTVICLLASAIALFCIHDSQKTAKAVTTYWHKIPPNTCVINADHISISDNDDPYGVLKIDSSASGYVNLEAFCPVNLTHGVTAKTLRIRDFQTGGLPTDTLVLASLKRRSWAGGTYTLGTASIVEATKTYDDADVTTTINNESYQYLVHVKLTRYSGATESPELSMIEIKFEQ